MMHDAVRRGFTIVETMLALGVVSALTAVVIGTVNSRGRLTDARDAERNHHVKQLNTAMSNHIYSTQSTQDFDAVAFPTGEANSKHLCRQTTPPTIDPRCVNLDFLVTSNQLTELPYDKTEQCTFFSGYEVYWGPGTRPFAKAIHMGKMPGDVPGSINCTPSCGNGSCGSTESCSTCPADCGVCGPACGDASCNGTETCSTCPGDCGTCPPVCGNGVPESGEGCDDGNGSNTDACLTTCQAATCGDGYVQGGVETCWNCPADVGACPTVEYTIDSDVDATVLKQQRNPSVVFINDTTGYAFYTDNGGRCVYSKTTTGGTSWGSAVNITAQPDCTGVVVWYDQWTPGDTTGNYIHILFADTGADDLWYRRLDTSSDTFSFAEVSTSSPTAGPAQANTLTNTNRFSITKATDGKIFVGVADGPSPTNLSFILQCSGSCNTTNSWSVVTANPLNNADDDLRLLPLPGGKILLINWDISTPTNNIRSKVWNGAAWDASWTTIGSATYVAAYRSVWGATVKKSNNDIYLVWNSQADSNLGDFKTARYVASTSLWDTSTAPITTGTSDRGFSCDIAIDESSGKVYVARLDWVIGGAIKFVDVLVKSSTDDMASWSTDTKVSVTSLTDDARSLSLNMMSPFRLFATWYTNIIIIADSIDGTTIADP